MDDERLEIVCCWHQLYDDDKLREFAKFDRYPSLEHPDDPENKITPDFLVDFPKHDYRIIGEICRLPADDDGFDSQLAQPKLYARSSDNVDVLFLIHHSFAEKNEKRALERGLLSETGEQVIFVSFVRESLGGNFWWYFQRASRFRQVDFRDGFVGEWSLHHRMTETMDGVHVPSKRWGAYKAMHPTCNDAPYPIYMACLLWDKVFPKMIRPARYEDSVAEGGTPVWKIVADEASIRDKARFYLNNDRIRTSWVRRALELLADAKRAEKRGQTWTVQWGALKAPREDIRDLHLKLIHRLAPKDFEGDVGAGVPDQATLFGDPPLPTTNAPSGDEAPQAAADV